MPRKRSPRARKTAEPPRSEPATRGPTAVERLLSELYYSPNSPGAYTSVEPLYRLTQARGFDIPRQAIRDWLKEQDTYTLHRPARRHFSRNRVIVGGMDSQWQADLVDMSALRQHNDGYRYLLTCIDVLSKYAWVVPIRTKTGANLIAAFKTIFASGRRPLQLQTDEGTEFLNAPFQTFLRQNKVHFFHTWNETKASIVERFNRTFKGRMYKHFTANNTRRYLDVLPALVEGYNRAYHRSIRRAPSQVTVRNQKQVRGILYRPRPPSTPHQTFRAGDRVRISKVKGRFEKSYLPNWSTEIFRVVRKHARDPPVYTLEDLNGEVLQGTFYSYELQKVVKAEDAYYQVERVLDTRKRRGKTEHLVKWLGWPASFNSWVSATDVKGI